MSDITYANQVEEHKAWMEMFNEICKKCNITAEELNKKEYRPIFVAIEKWSYLDFHRRLSLRNEGSEHWNDYGLFYKGDANDK